MHVHILISWLSKSQHTTLIGMWHVVTTLIGIRIIIDVGCPITLSLLPLQDAFFQDHEANLLCSDFKIPNSTCQTKAFTPYKTST